MIDSLFMQGPPLWSVQSPVVAGWYPSSPGVAPPALASQAPALGGLPQATPLPSPTQASALVAAVAWRRGQPNGPTNDQEGEEVLYDALEFVPGTNDVDIRCESGRVTLSGAVPHKRLKRDVGEIAWSIPALSDVANNITIASRRRARSFGREAESASAGPARKQA